MTVVEDLLRKLYSNCGLEGDLRQLMILLRQLSKEYFAQEATEEDAKAVIKSVCKVVVAHMASCGKQYAPDQCEKEFLNALLMSPPDNVFMDLRKNLRKKKKSNEPSGTPIL